MDWVACILYRRKRGKTREDDLRPRNSQQVAHLPAIIMSITCLVYPCCAQHLTCSQPRVASLANN